MKHVSILLKGIFFAIFLYGIFFLIGNYILVPISSYMGEPITDVGAERYSINVLMGLVFLFFILFILCVFYTIGDVFDTYQKSKKEEGSK